MTTVNVVFGGFMVDDTELAMALPTGAIYVASFVADIFPAQFTVPTAVALFGISP